MTSSRARPRKAAVTKRTVADHGDTVLLAPGKHGMLDGTLLEMVENLIADQVALTSNLDNLFQVGHVKVAHPPAQDLALTLQQLEGRNGVLQRVRTAPVQEIT